MSPTANDMKVLSERDGHGSERIEDPAHGMLIAENREGFSREVRTVSITEVLV